MEAGRGWGSRDKSEAAPGVGGHWSRGPGHTQPEPHAPEYDCEAEYISPSPLVNGRVKQGNSKLQEKQKRAERPCASEQSASALSHTLF